MASSKQPPAAAALRRLRHAMTIDGVDGPSDRLEALLLKFLRQLPEPQALIMERRLNSLARAVEALGPQATVEEISDLARSYERKPN